MLPSPGIRRGTLWNSSGTGAGVADVEEDAEFRADELDQRFADRVAAVAVGEAFQQIPHYVDHRTDRHDAQTGVAHDGEHRLSAQPGAGRATTYPDRFGLVRE